jgi:hypothetical protein
MEDAIKTLQDQANRIEEFLPNLALRDELYAMRDEVMRHARMLNEATNNRIDLLAEGLADVRERMATKTDLKEAIDGLEQRLEQRLGARLARLSEQISALANGRRKN